MLCGAVYEHMRVHMAMLEHMRVAHVYAWAHADLCAEAQER